jgi:hypothetical protein
MIASVAEPRDWHENESSRPEMSVIMSLAELKAGNDKESTGTKRWV